MRKLTDLTEEHRTALCEFADCLTASGYGLLSDAYGYDDVRVSAVRFDLPFLPADLADLASFLVLGDPVSREKLQAIVPASSIATLLDLGLVDFNGEELTMANHQLSMFFGSPIFVERPSIRRQAYFGSDSLALGRLLSTAKGNTLDLCCGVGAQTALLAKTASRVFGVERNESIRWMFDVNMAMNGTSARTEFLVGDLWNPVRGMRFDLIVCNPPLLPVPEGVNFPLVGNGGTLGIDFTESIAKEAAKFLRSGGRCVTIGSVLGNEGGPFLRSVYEALNQNGLKCVIILPFREEMKVGLPFFDALIRTAALHSSVSYELLQRSYSESLCSINATHVYSFLLLASATDRFGRPDTSITRHYLRSNSFWSI